MINLFNNSSDLANTFCEKLVQLSSGSEKFFAALSGGSTPKIIFQTLSKNFKDKIDWSKIHFFWGDERCVPPGHAESNFGMTRKYLLDNISIAEENIHRIKGEDNPEQEADRYSEEIKKYVPQRNGFPQFDIVMLGLGEDGHTASIFPEQIKLLSSGKICETAVHPETKQKRITITGNVINNSKRILFLVTGKNKARVLADIFNKNEVCKKYPAAYIKPADGVIEWYLDKEAASLINELK